RLRQANQSESVVNMGRKLRQLIDEYANAVREGQLPAPPPFANSSFVRLGTAHDPLPLLEQITQPVLVILGESDAIVPTGHSALLFDRAFKQAGNQDYTILLYPHANHAIQVPVAAAQGENEFEFVEGYHDTLSTWVVAHGRGTGSTGHGIQGNTIDQSAAFSEAGIYGRLPWYGGAATQLTLLLLFSLVFSSACLILPINALRGPQRGRSATALPLGMSLLNLILLGAFVVLAAELLLGSTDLTLSPLFVLFPLLTLLSAVLAMGMIVQGFSLWKNRRGSWTGRVYFSILTGSALLFVPFLLYWNFPGLSM
nr:prolyl oligopeptidase family serine peptidase [Ardenticatenales bacterium]